MNRLRVEGLLAAFPKLVEHSKQHTFVETDSVRYVYQPLENHMYLLLVTTKASNIVEDLGTLRLLAKVIPDVAGGLHEHAINENAFDLIFAFDEVLTAGGYKEEATLSSIRTNLLMDSHEEKVHLALQESKQAAAKDEMRKQEKAIRERQMKQMRQNLVSGGISGAMQGSMPGIGGGGGPPGGDGMFQGFGSDSAQFGGGHENQYAPEPAAPPKPEPPKVVAKGMKLGGGGAAGKKNSMMAAMAAEDNLMPLGAGGKDPFGLGGMGAAPAPAPVAPATPLSLVLEEKISVAMNREGSIESCEVKGTLTLTSNTDAGTSAVVAVNKNTIAGLPGWTFATHPKVDKKTYEKNGVLSLKGGKGFPVGRPVGILRWSYGSEDAAPITINCWPEAEGGSINVNIEYELNRPDAVLNDVNILLPLGTTDAPVIESIDGQYKHDPQAGMMCWHFDSIDESNSTGAMEFSIPGSSVDAFFPVQVLFKSEKLLCPIEVTSITSSANGTTIPNTFDTRFVPDAYQCA